MYKPQESKKVSIVIPNWFREGQDGKYGKDETLWFAKECYARLQNVTDSNMYELIVIDNGSTIGEDFLRDEVKPDVYIRNESNRGFGPACNQGFALSKGEYVLCMNNDILVWPGWLEAMLAPFDMAFEPPAGVVMPALVRDTRDAREAIKLKEINLHQNEGRYGAGAAFGSCWVIPRRLLEKVKRASLEDDMIFKNEHTDLGEFNAEEHIECEYYFDEKFKVGFGEDRDLWDRVRLLGYETYRTHDTRVFHQGNMTMTKVPNRRSYTEPNREYLARKRAARSQK